MKINPDRLVRWFDYVRYQNHKSQRFSECFFDSQVKSKNWLVDNMPLPDSINGPIFVFGGWYGVLAAFIRDNSPAQTLVYTIDVDVECEDIVRLTCEDQIIPITADMAKYNYHTAPGLVINTSTEHVTQEAYEEWWSKVPKGTPFILQGNNFFKSDEHIRCSVNLDQFLNQCNLGNSTLLYGGSLDCGDLERYMIRGIKQ